MNIFHFRKILTLFLILPFLLVVASLVKKPIYADTDFCTKDPSDMGFSISNNTPKNTDTVTVTFTAKDYKNFTIDVTEEDSTSRLHKDVLSSNDEHSGPTTYNIDLNEITPSLDEGNHYYIVLHNNTDLKCSKLYIHIANTVTSCVLKITGFSAGGDINFELSGLQGFSEYRVRFYSLIDGNWGVRDAKFYNTAVLPIGVPITDSFNANLFKDGATSYQLQAHQTAPTFQACDFPPPFDPPDGDGGTGQPGENPCSATECPTALGNIATNPGAFATKILSIAVGLAGGIAFILMVIGAIRVLTSAGNPQNVNAGRDMIVAAVAGLLFLIFSVIILQFIVGVHLLNIPGFTGFIP